MSNRPSNALSSNNNSNGLISGYLKRIKERGGLFANGSFDYLLFVFVITAVGLGLTVMYSASYPDAYAESKDPSFYLKKQLVGAVIGMVFMLLLSKINYEILMEPGAYIGSIVSIGLLVIALIVGSGDEDDDIKRWIKIGGFQFQPSDIAKLALILTLAYILHKYHALVISKKPLDDVVSKKINRIFNRPMLNRSFIPIMMCAFTILVYVGLVLLGSHLSGAIILLGISVCILFAGEVRLTWFVLGIGCLAFAVVMAFSLGIIQEYQIARIMTFLGITNDPLGDNWQTQQALYAIGSGGFLGKGIGQSIQKYDYVPEAQNDMIFSIAVEELGFVGGVAIILLFALIIWRGAVIGINSNSRYGALVAFGITFKLAIQVFLNIAVATNIIPNTGITLPFFSYGRTGLIMTFGEIGLLLAISRKSRIKKH